MAIRAHVDMFCMRDISSKLFHEVDITVREWSDAVHKRHARMGTEEWQREYWVEDDPQRRCNARLLFKMANRFEERKNKVTPNILELFPKTV